MNGFEPVNFVNWRPEAFIVLEDDDDCDDPGFEPPPPLRRHTVSDDETCGDENTPPLFGRPNVWCCLLRGHEGPHHFTWTVETRAAEKEKG